MTARKNKLKAAATALNQIEENTVLSDPTRKEIAGKIIDCFREKKQIGLLTKAYPDIEIEDSYRIQELVIDSFKKDGCAVKGYKIGLTSQVMQKMVGTNEPDFSVMTDNMFELESSNLKCSDWMTPHVEIEVAFVMKDALTGPKVNAADVIRATDFILPSIELVDLRVAMAPGMDVRDTIADLAGVGAIVLGGNPVRLDAIDVRNITGQLIINDETLETGLSSAVLGNPVNAVVWLVNKLSEFGVSFQPGDVIMSGSFVRALPVSAGDKVIARFDNGLGDVALDFS